MPLAGLCRNENLKYITAAKVSHNILITNTPCALQKHLKKHCASFSDDYKITPVRITAFCTLNTEKLTFFMNIFETSGLFVLVK